MKKRKKGFKRTFVKEGVWKREGTGFKGCCDCGLVHYVEYRVKKWKIWTKNFRAVKATEESRKRFKFPCVPRRGR